MFDGLRAQTLLRKYKNNTRKRYEFTSQIRSGKLNIKNSKVLNAYIELLLDGIHNSDELSILIDNDIPMEILYSNETLRQAIKKYYEEIFKLNDEYTIRNLVEDKFFQKILLNDDFRSFINLESLKSNIDLKIVNIVSSSFVSDFTKKDIENMIAISEKIGHKVFSVHHFLSDDVRIERYDSLIYHLVSLNLFSDDILNELYYRIYNSTLIDGQKLASSLKKCANIEIPLSKYENLFDYNFCLLSSKKVSDFFDEHLEPSDILFTDGVYGNCWSTPLNVVKNSCSESLRLGESIKFLAQYSEQIKDETIQKFFGLFRELDVENKDANNVSLIYFSIKDELINVMSVMNDLTNESEIISKLYDIALFDEKSFIVLFSNTDWKEHYNVSAEIEQYINFVKEKGFILTIGSKEDIIIYFDANGPTEKLYEEALFSKNMFRNLFGKDDWKEHYNASREIEQYINFIKENGFILDVFIRRKEDILSYFDENGLTENILFDPNFSNVLFKLANVEKYYYSSREIEQYINFVKETGCNLNDFIERKEDILFYFDENGPTDRIEEIYDVALCDPSKFYFFRNDTWKKYYHIPSEIEQYINFVKENGLNLMRLIRIKKDITVYFDKNGPTEKLFEEALFNENIFISLFANTDWRKFYPVSEEMEQYINFVKENGLNLIGFIGRKEAISIYFDKKGPTEKLFVEALLNRNMFRTLFENDDWKERYNASEEIEQYINFIKANGFILGSFIESKEDISNYFDKKGPTEKLYDRALVDKNIFKNLFGKDDWKDHYNASGEIDQYIRFIKETELDLTIYIKRKEDIDGYFNENGPKQDFLVRLLKNSINSNVLNNPYLVKYYNSLYNSYTNNIESEDLLNKLNDFCNSELIRGNYIVLLKFMVEIDYQSGDTLIKKGIPNTSILFSSFNNEQLNDICKYCLLYNDNSMDQLSNIISSHKLANFLRIYNFLFIEWSVDNFKSLLENYMNNINLCESIVEYIDSASSFIEIDSHFFDDKREKIMKILVSGDKNALGKIMTVNDLNNYKQIIYNSNIGLIESTHSIDEVKDSIYNLLFNLNLGSINKLLSRYNASEHKLNNIITTINDPLCKEKLSNISIILDFIDSLTEETNIDKLKEYLRIINESYLNNSDIFEELWQHFISLEKELNKILGMEINEKITNFNELIEFHKQGDIPMGVDGNPLFSVTNQTLSSDFEYDGKTFKAGTDIPYIELTGLPFVTFGHVLNAYGSGGKVSDFNNPRLIGRTHLCLSAIDDNYYNLVERHVSDIEHVQLLFSSLPANQLVMASDCDVSSRSDNNSRNITSWKDGNYNSVRENISNTYHGVGGYNEYVYYRDNIKPSAILIKGDEPNEAELQAAAYLQVPLVKINKQYYPELTQEAMKRRDQELKEFYKEMYERRKKQQSDVNEQKDEVSIRFLLVREQLGQLKSYYNDLAINESGKVR